MVKPHHNLNWVEVFVFFLHHEILKCRFLCNWFRRKGVLQNVQVNLLCFTARHCSFV